MADMHELIKKIALAVVEESKPTAVLFGEVTSVSPLKITIDQKLTLDENFLILTNNVRDHKVDMTFDFSTKSKTLDGNHSHDTQSSGDISVTSKLKPEQPGTVIENEVTNTSSTSISEAKINLTHSHDIKGKTTVTVHYGLKKGEKVILIRYNKGQKFLVLDRVV